MVVKTRKQILEMMELEQLVVSEYDPVSNKPVKVDAEVAAAGKEYLSNDIMIYLKASPIFQTLKKKGRNMRLEDNIEMEENDVVDLGEYFLDEELKAGIKENTGQKYSYNGQKWNLDEVKEDTKVYQLERDGPIDVYCWVEKDKDPEFTVKVNPGQLVLTYSNEYLKYPNNHMGRIYSRSNHGRKFRFDCTDGSAQVNKPGSNNAIVLELTATNPVHVAYGDKIGYITVEEVGGEVPGGYNGKSLGQGPHEKCIRTASYKKNG